LRSVEDGKNDSLAWLAMQGVTPCMGPWPLEDKVGMLAVLAMLVRSLDKGVYEDTFQWDTFRRTMLTLTNIAHAVVGGMEDSVRAYKRD
jgi:uncharacterized protein (DUF2236 family)